MSAHSPLRNARNTRNRRYRQIAIRLEHMRNGPVDIQLLRSLNSRRLPLSTPSLLSARISSSEMFGLTFGRKVRQNSIWPSRSVSNAAINMHLPEKRTVQTRSVYSLSLSLSLDPRFSHCPNNLSHRRPTRSPIRQAPTESRALQPVRRVQAESTTMAK